MWIISWCVVDTAGHDDVVPFELRCLISYRERCLEEPEHPKLDAQIWKLYVKKLEQKQKEKEGYKGRCEQTGDKWAKKFSVSVDNLSGRVGMEENYDIITESRFKMASISKDLYKEQMMIMQGFFSIQIR